MVRSPKLIMIYIYIIIFFFFFLSCCEKSRERAKAPLCHRNSSNFKPKTIRAENHQAPIIRLFSPRRCVRYFYKKMSQSNGVSNKDSFVENGAKRFKLTDIDEETLNSGAEG